MRKFFLAAAMTIAMLNSSAYLHAQGGSAPKNVVLRADNQWYPAPGYVWVSPDPKDLRVRWAPGTRHPSEPNVIAAQQENQWSAAPGYRWVDPNNPRDLRVVANFAPAPGTGVAGFAPAKGPSDEAIARAVLKALGAAVLHENAKPQPGDGFAEAIARGFARTARDELIASSLLDLFPGNTLAERQAVGNLIVLALDGRMPRSRDQILGQLRQSNPNFANGAEAAEYLIRFAQALEDARR